MPYTIRKQDCKQSDGTPGSYVLSYTDKKGKKHRACHTSKKKAKGQIAAIEMEGIEESVNMKTTVQELRQLIREYIGSAMALRYEEKELEEDEFTYKIAKAAKAGKEKVKIGDKEFPVKMSKEKAKDILDELDEDT